MECECRENVRDVPVTKKASADYSDEAFLKTGNTYFRTGGHYHRLRKLDFCVRDGNRYDLSDMVTGKELAAYSPARAYKFIDW